MSGFGDMLEGQGGLGGVLGGLLGGGGSSGGMAAALIPLVAGLLSGGGLNKLLSGLQGGGLEEKANSWVRTDANEPVSGEEIQQASARTRSPRCQPLGVSREEAAAALAEVLPAVVDRVTPDGTVPADDEVDGALDSLARSVAGA